MATVSYLVVAGGGGGGRGSLINRGSGGGGAGGMLTGSDTITAGSFAIVVGGGGGAASSGAGAGTNGSNSSFNGHTATGGGGGGSADTGTGAGNGGSGGGAGDSGGASVSGGTSTVGQGNNGGANSGSAGNGGSGGGGGGAGGAGSVGVNGGVTRPTGGVGSASSISGASVTYAAGGSGGEYTPGTAGATGTANTGNGGGGGGGNSAAGGDGGSGIVILSYPTGALAATGGTITTSGGNTIHTFTAGGTFLIVSVFATLIATQSQAVRVVTGLVRFKSLIAVQAQVAQLTIFKLRAVLLVATQTAIATLTRLRGKFLFAKQAQLTSVFKDDAFVYITINGVNYGQGRSDTSVGILYETLNITEADGQHARCLFTTDGVGLIPAVGADVIIRLEDRRIFGGVVNNVDQGYVGSPSNVQCHVSAIAYSWLFDRLKRVAQYITQSASAIAQDVVTRFAPGFTANNVQPGLDVIASISFVLVYPSDMVKQLAKWVTSGVVAAYVDYFKDLHFSITDREPNPIDITPAHPTLLEFASQTDLSQVVTRMYGRVSGGSVGGAAAAGATTLEVTSSATALNPAGGLVVCAAQRLSYTALSNLAAPAAPSTAKGYGTGSIAAGDTRSISTISRSGTTATVTTSSAHGFATGSSVIIAGAASSAYNGTWTIIVTGSTTFTFQVPGTPGNVGAGGTAKLANSGNMSGTYRYKVSLVTASGETLASVASASVSPVGVTAPAAIGTMTATTGGNLTPSSTYYYGVTFVTVQGETDVVNNASVTLNGAQNAVALTNIPTAADNRVIARKIYRSLPGGSTGPFYYITTLNDNTTTAFTDNAADTSLATQSLTENRAGYGSVILTSIPTSADSRVTSRKIERTATGGATYYVIGTIGNNTDTTWTDTAADTSLGQVEPAVSTVPPLLTGIPAVGTGAIVTAINSGEQVDGLVQVDNAAAQTALAGLLLITLGAFSDGIQEDVIDCGDVTYTEALTRTTAALNQRLNPEVRVRYKCRDPLTRVGRTVSVNMPAPQSVVGSFKLQQVTISDFQPKNSTLYPVYTAQGSTTRVSLEDLLKLALAA